MSTNKTLLCLSVAVGTVEEARETLSEPTCAFDVAELRLDFTREPNLRQLLDGRPCPVIVTNRPVREGGHWSGDERQRLAILEEADRLGADFVDVELDARPHFRRQGRARLIVSYHNFQCTPPDIRQIAKRIEATDADIVKVATMANSLADNLAIFEVLQAATKPTIALTMGEHGHVSRILAPKFGAFLVYAAPSEGRQVAPGQVPVDQMLSLYRFRRIGPATRVYGVIANPVAHSMSPAIHNAAFAHCGLDAVYLPFRVDDPAEFIPPFRRLPVSGYSVTIPHKEAVIVLLDEVQPLARKIGAVNTIVERQGKLFGSNTDWSAALRAIESALPEGQGLAGRQVLMLGAGGAARAIAYGLVERGCRLVIANRTVSRAERLAGELGCRWTSLDQAGDVPYDVLVNATSVGMHPDVDATPLAREHLRPGAIVFDSVYNPIETRLLREAREAGCVVVNGLEMFVNQAVEQFELWTGQPAPREVMRSVVESRLRH